MNNTRLKVRHLEDVTYQVVEFYLNQDNEYEDESIVYQGSLSDCEAYIRLSNGNFMI